MAGLKKKFPGFIGVFLLIVFFSDCSQAQPPKTSIQFTAIIEQVLSDSDKEKSYLYENYDISFSSLPGASLSNLNAYLADRYPDQLSNGIFQVGRNIQFNNCRFGKLVIDQMAFQNLTISNSEVDEITITNSRFEALILHQNKVSHSLEISRSKMVSLELKDNTVD
jgi:hypothetical protein